MDGVYTCGSAGYSDFVTWVPIRHCGGVVLFYQNSLNFSVEAILQFSANVITCQLEMGERRWCIVGCYLDTVDAVTIWDVEAAMSERLRRKELIVAGDLNIDLERTGGRVRDKDIAAVFATEGLEDLLKNLLPKRRLWCRDWRKWAMV